ncbi:GNAT family N-acetyltransferase [Bacillus sp. 03113]|uniref:GNAT family N-acetyltransferase n=1 Tax=Bacillus sp. 03113 TaxID=2578211 RepID=UPI001142C2D9|nr:GNAT family N-acetyltransferase [Bacillus sp. 03113]
MISQLNVNKKRVANEILSIQIPAYKVEAALIGFDGIPALKDTIETIMECRETFIGYVLNQDLVGFISYTESDNQLDICRLVVHPLHFRKGIGKELVQNILDKVSVNKKIVVSTGKKNTPAKKLYSSLGFHECKDVEVAPGIFITFFEKN